MINTYYRGINKLDSDIDIKDQYSIERIADIEDIAFEYMTEDEVYELDRDELIEKVNDIVYNDFLVYKNGHDGEGLYWNGVCACETREEVEDYFSARFATDSIEIIEFEGKYLTNSYDCVIVQPV